MSLLGPIIATTIFEIKRSFSVQRLLVFWVLALFPPAMLAVIAISSRGSVNGIALSDFLLCVLVFIVSILAQLLWATSNVYTELEGKSWIFLASRPRGRISLLLGKYFSAVVFSTLVCAVAITLGLVIRSLSMGTLFSTSKWIGLNVAFAISCATYSAIFSIVGTLFQKRAMVFGASYFFLSELVLANIPAIISKFTPRFHLQTLSIHLVGWYLPLPEKEYYQLYGESTFGFHLICLLIAIPVFLTIGCMIVVSRQYITADET